MSIHLTYCFQKVFKIPQSRNSVENDLRYLMGEVVDMLERAGASMPDQHPKITTRYGSDGSARVSAPITPVGEQEADALDSLIYAVKQIVRIMGLNIDGLTPSVEVEPTRTGELFIVTLVIAASH